MKKTLLILFAFIGLFVAAQDTAYVKVTVVDDASKALPGEQVVFVAKDGKYQVKGVSDAQGLFTVPLVGGKVYDIQLKSIGDAQEYNTLEIPALKPNTRYGEYTLEITIFPPKIFTLKNVFFDSGKSTLQANSYKELQELVEYLQLKKDIKVEIAGHTDNVGTPESNVTLSEERAKTVVNYLISKGIDANRLSFKGYGDTQPVADNASETGRKQNRRTEVRILE